MRDCLLSIWETRKFVVAWSVPFIYSPLLFLGTSEMSCAYVALIMMTYWFFELISIYVTALIPLFLFPLVGVMSSASVCICYFNVTLMVFLGSLIAATAVEKSCLHVRLALKVMISFDITPRKLLLGFMITTAFFSMFISNVAAVLLMIPIVNAAMNSLANRQNQSKNKDHKSTGIVKKEMMTPGEYSKLRKGLMLGVCYASNIGGTGALTGTPTNLVLNAVLKERQLSYAEWLLFNFPSMWLLIVLTWLFICVYYLNISSYKGQSFKQKEMRKTVENQYNNLGPMNFSEKAVCFVFCLMLFLWFFRQPRFMPGWTDAFTSDKTYIKDQVPAIFCSILFFMIPVDPWNLKKTRPILDWKTAQDECSWGVLLLIGGGFALAKGCEQSGLSKVMSVTFGNLTDGMPPALMCFVLMMIAAILTECTSNAATCTILLPVVKPLAEHMNIDPLYLMLPITVACSYASMLPVASGTNAIVFELAKMKTQDMFVPGFAVKMICCSVLYLTTNTWGVVLFQFK